MVTSKEELKKKINISSSFHLELQGAWKESNWTSVSFLKTWMADNYKDTGNSFNHYTAITGIFSRNERLKINKCTWKHILTAFNLFHTSYIYQRRHQAILKLKWMWHDLCSITFVVTAVEDLEGSVSLKIMCDGLWSKSVIIYSLK